MDTSPLSSCDSSTGVGWTYTFQDHVNDEKYDREAAERRMDAASEADIEEEIIFDAIHQLEVRDRLNPPRRRQRLDVNRPKTFAETLYGQMIQHPDVNNPGKKMGKEFRRKFRLPFPLFQHLVALCREHNIFARKISSKIPIEGKVLIGLRMLGSGAHTSIIADCTSLFFGQSTVLNIFHEFVAGVTEHLFPIFVRFPTGDDLKEVMEVYSRLGLPGACGSIDCTHIRWTMCPKKLTHSCTGIYIFFFLIIIFFYCFFISKEKRGTRHYPSRCV
jgi:hypothetical protein